VLFFLIETCRQREAVLYAFAAAHAITGSGTGSGGRI
jgi:hypothetical protein